MNRLDGKFLTVDDSLHVHQAGAVGSGNIFGPGFAVVPDFVFCHTDGYGLFFDCEHSAEAATFIYVGRFAYFDVFHLSA